MRLTAEPGLPPWRVVLRGPADVRRGGGGEDYVQRLQREFAGPLGGRIAWEPPLFDPAALAQFYGTLDIFCYPSLAAQGEGLSVAPLEAMAAGAVPVLSRLDCYRDMLHEGANGFAFDQTAPGANAELAGILARLITDSGLRRAAAAQAQAEARRFDHAVVARALLDDFAQLTR